MKSISHAKYLKKIILFNLTLFSVSIFAQKKENKKAFISGSVDTYYRTNLLVTDSEVNGTTVAPLTSFAKKNWLCAWYGQLDCKLRRRKNRSSC